jgi:hypothetical protein
VVPSHRQKSAKSHAISSACERQCAVLFRAVVVVVVVVVGGAVVVVLTDACTYVPIHDTKLQLIVTWSEVSRVSYPMQ